MRIRDKSLVTAKDLRKLPLVMVKWRDPCSTGGWASLEGARASGPAECQTVGWVTKWSKREVQIVQSISDTGKVLDSISIPRACVISAKRVRL